ncbi:MAG: DUF547 domain-containing protein [Clostridia bacterium]
MATRLILAALALAAALPTPAAAFDHSHRAWDALLRRHVVVAPDGRSSRVSYAGLALDKEALDGYLDGVSAVKEGEFAAWTRNEQMAFLLNAYNAFTAAKVLSRYPDLRSIRDFGVVFGNPFRDEFFMLLGRRASLDSIEHGMLRPRYKEARIHFALNCAAVGCPMLREEAYVASRLERQLEEQQARFLSDRSRNRVRGGRLEVSKIFDWYGDDFAPLPGYFAAHAGLLGALPEEIRRMKIDFLDYDWSLNDAK